MCHYRHKTPTLPTPALLVTAEVEAVRGLARAQDIEVCAKPLQVHALTAALDRALRPVPTAS